MFHIGGLSYDNLGGETKLGCSDPEIPKSLPTFPSRFEQHPRNVQVVHPMTGN